MSFDLSVPLVRDGQVTISLNVGQVLFVVGANGSGKSSLLQRMTANTREKSYRISASRQTWFQSSAIEFSPSQKIQLEQNAQNWSRNTQSRWMEHNPQFRSGLTLFDLIDAENVDARRIAQAMRTGDIEEAKQLAKKAAPIAKINDLFAHSGMPIEISVENGDRILASKDGGAPYGAAELSDGERNALLIAADILTAEADTLLIIDEPERHLHRSIIAPLLSALFRERDDCAFVVATHDLMLPLDNPDARTLLVRACAFSGQTPTGWDVDVMEAHAEIDEDLKRDILGSRRQIIFTEGDESSLDKPLYNVLFPGISVRSKSTSREVEQSTAGLRAAESTHWVRAWGIIDNDGRPLEEIENLKKHSVFTLPFHSVEALYYHPNTILSVAIRHAAVVGGDGGERAALAIRSALEALETHLERLAARSVERRIRRQFYSNLPTLKSIQARQSIELTINVSEWLDAETASLRNAVTHGDWLEILRHCPIRETPALDVISRGIGLRDHHQYESAALQLLREDVAARDQLLSLFGNLVDELG